MGCTNSGGSVGKGGNRAGAILLKKRLGAEYMREGENYKDVVDRMKAYNRSPDKNMGEIAQTELPNMYDAFAKTDAEFEKLTAKQIAGTATAADMVRLADVRSRRTELQRNINLYESDYALPRSEQAEFARVRRAKGITDRKLI